MPDQPQLTPPMDEKSELSGPTYFSNRYTVQTYPDGGVRLVFAERYSNDNRVSAVYRTAVFLHNDSALELAQIIFEQLGVTITRTDQKK
jgi:hypothetical protein